MTYHAASPNQTLASALHQEATKAQRAGMSLETVIATFIYMADTMQHALPYVQAADDANRGSPCG